MKDIGIYIHIPFCMAKCNYCDFNSYSNMEYMEEFYVDALIKEMKQRFLNLDSQYNIKSIYIGGGTPTYLNYENLKKLLIFLNKFYKDGIEYTCEANPGTLSYEKLWLLKEYGVNRLSIGLQSLDNNILKYLGRVHSFEDFMENYKVAREVGFENINVDLMFSIQGQTIDDFANGLKFICDLNPEHISCYGLIIEENTAFGRLYKSGKLQVIDEDTDYKMYKTAISILKDKGYIRYEISNYAKAGFESTHNIIYWKTKEYIGFGAGAHSYIDGLRFSNDLSIKKYIEKIDEGRLPTCFEEKLSIKEEMAEFMFMGLRMMEGVELLDFKKRFGIDIMSVYGKQIEEMIKKDLAIIYNDIDKKSLMLKLSDKGIDISNSVFIEFI